MKQFSQELECWHYPEDRYSADSFPETEQEQDRWNPGKKEILRPRLNSLLRSQHVDVTLVFEDDHMVEPAVLASSWRLFKHSSFDLRYHLVARLGSGTSLESFSSVYRCAPRRAPHMGRPWCAGGGGVTRAG